MCEGELYAHRYAGVHTCVYPQRPKELVCCLRLFSDRWLPKPSTHTFWLGWHLASLTEPISITPALGLPGNARPHLNCYVGAGMGAQALMVAQ